MTSVFSEQNALRFFWGGGGEKSGKQCQGHFHFPQQEELRATPSLLCDITEAPQGKTSIFRRGQLWSVAA